MTRHDVEDAAAAGQPVRLGARDVLTHEAAQRARDLGVAVERAASGRTDAASTTGAGSAGSAPGAPPSRASGAAASDAALRAAVRSAVVAELGREPAGLDAAIERVMARERA